MFKVCKYRKCKGELIQLSEFLSIILIFKGNYLVNYRSSINILIQAIGLCTDIQKSNVQESLLSFILYKNINDTSNLLFIL